MSGRRSHPRFAVANPWNGSIRILRDVVVDRVNSEELLAVSTAAAIVGEELSLDLIGGGQSLAIRVRVLESRPVIIEGTVRHRVRLALPQVAPAAIAAPVTVADVQKIAIATERVAEGG